MSRLANLSRQAPFAKDRELQRKLRRFDGSLCRHLTAQEYQDLFGSDTLPMDQVAAWNERFPSDPLEPVSRSEHYPQLFRYYVLYRHQLPEWHESVLAAHEARGKVYTGLAHLD